MQPLSTGSCDHYHFCKLHCFWLISGKMPFIGLIWIIFACLMQFRELLYCDFSWASISTLYSRHLVGGVLGTMGFIWSHVSYNEVANWSQVYLIASNLSAAACQTPTSWHGLFVNTYQYCISLICGIFEDIFTFSKFLDFLPMFWEYLYQYWLCLVALIF